MKRDLNVIVCPKCEREYLPSEIFVPKYFFGTATTVCRNSDGKILDIQDNTMDTTESYKCDNCNTNFQVVANVSFTTYLEDTINFDEGYEINLKTGHILKEI